MTDESDKLGALRRECERLALRLGTDVLVRESMPGMSDEYMASAEGPTVIVTGPTELAALEALRDRLAGMGLVEPEESR